MSSRRLRARPRTRAGRLRQRRGHRPPGDHRDPLHRPRPGPRRHPLLPLRVHGRRARGRPQPLARDVLQGRARRPRPRRRQGGHHRRPGHAQDRGAAARLRPLRAVAQRPLLHRLRRGHLLAWTWTTSRASAAYVTGRTVAHGGAGDSSVLTAYGVFQGMRAAAEQVWGEPTLAGRTVGVAGVGKVGRHLVRHLIEDGATVVVTDVHPPVDRARCATSSRRCRRSPTPSALVARRARRLRPVRPRRRAHRRGRRRAQREDRLRRRQQPARAPRRREAARGPRHPLRARLLRELRRPDPGRRRARGLLLRARAAARHGHLRDHPLGLRARRTDGVPPAIAADRLAERRMRDVGRLRGIARLAER